MDELHSRSIYFIILLVISFIGAVFFWDTPLLYPVKVFTVILHELSHGLAAVLTGGSIERIEISPQIGGVCYTRGGLQLVILPAGYLGSMFWGIVIMVVAIKTNWDKQLVMFIGFALIALVILYIRNFFGVIFSIGFAAAMILISRYANTNINEFVLLFLGFTSALYAIIDIKEDLISRTVHGSDAYAMAKALPILPPVGWGLLWIIIAVAVVFFTMKFLFFKE